MCGIAGFWTETPLAESDARDVLERMNAALAHRGPDASGVYFDRRNGVGFAHTRLSVIDLGPTGAQPMRSPSGRFVMTYNGELYNAPALRRELLARPHPPLLRGTSDTEVLLACLDAYGLAQTLPRLRGMFAFALFDGGELHLVRDRFGIKPLYLTRGTGARRGHGFGGVAFGSELRALHALGFLDFEIDRAAVLELLRFGAIGAPRSIYTSVEKLLPGAWLTFREASAEPVRRRYWCAGDAASRARRLPPESSAEELADELLERLSESVRLHTLSDVPLGALLSGGIDSSLIVALLRAESGTRVRSFSVGFREPAHDESAHAARIAAHLGSEHTELLVTPEDALAIVPDLPSIYDEPFADSSQIPTHLVARLARKSVKVVLTGDGGDELFGGYHRHVFGPRLWRVLERIPLRARRALGGLLDELSAPALGYAYARAGRWLPTLARPEDQVAKLVRALGAASPDGLYSVLRDAWHAELPVLGADSAAPWGPLPAPGAGDLASRFMLADIESYLPDDVLTKVDRATMAVGLEARVPFLDHELFEFSLRLPLELKIRDGHGKRILRRLLARYVPETLVDRPKAGFALPLGSWLRSELRDWAEALLDSDRLRRDGVLDARVIRAAWQRHLSGRANLEAALWPVLMFQAWSATC